MCCWYEGPRDLEGRYEAFFLSEPDVAPVRPGFLPAFVERSRVMGCGTDRA